MADQSRGSTGVSIITILHYIEAKRDADPEKKKYFRVQANHVAPAGSQYSREAVKRRKLDNEVYLHGSIALL